MQLLCEDNLRHNEYYGMQNTIDNLYQASLNGEVFTDLMSVNSSTGKHSSSVQKYQEKIREVKQVAQTISQSRTLEDVPPMRLLKS